MSKEQEALVAQETIKHELEVFMPDGSFELTSGEVLELPRVTWKKEKRIFKKVGELFNSVDRLHTIDFNKITTSQIVSIIGVLMQDAPDVITSLASEITDLTEEEVDDRLDSEDLVSLLVPFFSSKFQRLQDLVNKILTK